MSGRLIAVVGPSGAGKDSLIRGIVAARPAILWVRRAVTRPPDPTEPFESVSEAEFERRRAAGAFCFAWEAHGLGYGVPRETLGAVRGGAVTIANLSRTVLAQAAEVAPLTVLSVTASPAVLAARLAGRGREDANEIAARLARAAALPEGLDVAQISNDGTLRDAVDRALAALDARGTASGAARIPAPLARNGQGTT